MSFSKLMASWRLNVSFNFSAIPPINTPPFIDWRIQKSIVAAIGCVSIRYTWLVDVKNCKNYTHLYT